MVIQLISCIQLLDFFVVVAVLFFFCNKFYKIVINYHLVSMRVSDKFPRLLNCVIQIELS